MVKRVAILWVVLLAVMPSFGQEITFPKFLSQYVQDNRLSGQARGVPVIIITNRTANRCELVITMFAMLSEVIDHLPADYTYIDGQLLLIYDGTEQLYRRSTGWQSELKKAIGSQLCDNTILITIKNRSEHSVPCTFKYDPFEWKLTFTNGLLIHKELYQGNLFLNN